MSASTPAVSLRSDEGRAADLVQQEVDSVVGQKRPGSPLQPDQQSAGQQAAGPSGTAAARTAAAEPRSRRARQRANRRQRRAEAAPAAPPVLPPSAGVLEQLVDRIPEFPPEGQLLGGIPVQTSPYQDDIELGPGDDLHCTIDHGYRVGAGHVDSVPAFAVKVAVLWSAESTLVAAEALIGHQLPFWVAVYSQWHMVPPADRAFREAVAPCWGGRHIRWVVFAARFFSGCLEAVCIMPVLPGVGVPPVRAGFAPVLRHYSSGPALQATVSAPSPLDVGELRFVEVYIPDSVITACYAVAAAYYSAL